MLVQLLVAVSDSALRERSRHLSGEGLRVVAAEPDISPSEALERFAPDVLLVDRPWLGSDPGGRIAELRSGDRRAEVLLVATDRENADERAELLGLGCLSVIDGGAGEEEFRRAVIGRLRLWREDAIARMDADPGRDDLRLGDFFTSSPAMKKLIDTARRVSAADTSVLILGETGVGKERLASAIHASGPRRDNPLVVVNCGAIPETLLESELFGHERGAFTGAERVHRGYFELAHGGSILLDEIGEMPAHLQVKLLRVLQEREIRRIGGERPIAVDVRVMAATNRDLQDEMARKRFRSDLFYRLSVVTLTIPPLRDRTEDVSLLVQQYLQRFAGELRAGVRGVSQEAMRALTAYHWPGNVREIVNVMERAVLLSDSEQISLEDLPEVIASCYLPAELEPLVEGAADIAPQLDASWFRLPLRDARHAWNAAFEKLYLQRVLRETAGRVGQAAARIGIDPRSLYAKMRALGLRKEDFR